MKGTVVTLVTHIGEIIGQVEEETPDSFELKDPRLFVNQAEGAGLAPGICLTGIKDPTGGVFYKGSIVAVVVTSPELEKAWRQQTSGIILQ